MRGSVGGEFGCDPIGSLGEYRRAQLIGLGQHDLIGDTGTIKHVEQRSVDFLDAVAGVDQQTNTP